MPVYQAGGRVRLFYHGNQQHKDSMQSVYVTWHSVSECQPECDRAPDSFGVEVLIWPPKYDPGNDNHMRTAFFGKRVTDMPSFYKYGAVVDGVTHWAYMPEGPATPGVSDKRKTRRRAK